MNTSQLDHKKNKIIDVEKIDEADDNANGPIDVVDIFDEVTGDTSSHNHGRRRKYLYDNENPADNEEQDTLNQNEFSSEPANDQRE